MKTFMGYRRSDGRVGVRNRVIVLPTSVCAGAVARGISQHVPGTVPLPHEHGCCQVGADHAQTVGTLLGMGLNPNTGAILLVSLGCEGVQSEQVSAALRAAGKPVGSICIQETGGVAAAVAQGVEAAHALLDQCRQEREKSGLEELVLGMECGGSDATSGLAANPALGVVADLLIEAGATAILSETTEMVGAEHILARRAVSPEVAERLLERVRRTEERAAAMGCNLREGQPTPGNIAGGLTTIEEKSLGCIHKAGSSPLTEVVDYAERPSERGLVFMDTPGQDVESVSGMVAGGAQVVIFTTGRGSPTGNPVAPVIKVTGNGETYRRMPDCIDLNAGEIIDAGVGIDEMGRRMFDTLLRVCSGEPTRAEINGHQEFAVHRIGPTF